MVTMTVDNKARWQTVESFDIEKTKTLDLTQFITRMPFDMLKPLLINSPFILGFDFPVTERLIYYIEEIASLLEDTVIIGCYEGYGCFIRTNFFPDVKKYINNEYIGLGSNPDELEDKSFIINNTNASDIEILVSYLNQQTHLPLVYIVVVDLSKSYIEQFFTSHLDKKISVKEQIFDLSTNNCTRTLALLSLCLDAEVQSSRLIRRQIAI